MTISSQASALNTHEVQLLRTPQGTAEDGSITLKTWHIET